MQLMRINTRLPLRSVKHLNVTCCPKHHASSYSHLGASSARYICAAMMELACTNLGSSSAKRSGTSDEAQLTYCKAKHSQYGLPPHRSFASTTQPESGAYTGTTGERWPEPARQRHFRIKPGKYRGAETYIVSPLVRILRQTIDCYEKR